VSTSPAKRVLIVAGESSGDAQASRLAAAMLAQDPSVHLYGVGGEQMRAAGVTTFVDSASLSIMGFSEVVGGLRHVWSCYRRLVGELRSSDPPDLLILVDFPEINLLLAKVARRAGVKVFYYVSPQVWAWRRGRVRKICERVDRMVVLFPFEEELYRECGLDTYFVGHVLAEDVRPTRPAPETRRMYGISPDRPLVLLLPGSRSKEVKAVLPVMLAAVAALGGAATVALARAQGLAADLPESLIRAAGADVAIVTGDTYNLMAAADVVAVTSGTATVECALIGSPMVVMYRMSRLSYQLAKRLVRVPFIAMPNIILGRGVVPELVQSQATPETLSAELRRLLGSPQLRDRMREELHAVRSALVRPGAAARAAALALETMA